MPYTNAEIACNNQMQKLHAKTACNYLMQKVQARIIAGKTIVS